ncbi:unnamed protein product [Cyprideis torosa]|uniref:Uncharacterized protein n=1 Tax=Cyprideis torosa TaxID=163714 RepID=A0A7R8W4Y9_9CRUS|nr:unnamed protein product [Cyprideis torosa]CAG0880015.1 unnamed protein product [Cyprideis torosa]
MTTARIRCTNNGRKRLDLQHHRFSPHDTPPASPPGPQRPSIVTPSASPPGPQRPFIVTPSASPPGPQRPSIVTPSASPPGPQRPSILHLLSPFLGLGSLLSTGKKYVAPHMAVHDCAEFCEEKGRRKEELEMLCERPPPMHHRPFLPREKSWVRTFSDLTSISDAGNGFGEVQKKILFSD